MSFLDRIAACNTWDPSRYRVFRVDGVDVGLVAADTIRHLRRYPDVFSVGETAIDLAPGLASPDERTEAVARVLRDLADGGLIPGWRDEPYPVGTDFWSPPLFVMERAAVPLFGVRGYGIHVNGYVPGDGGMRMWIGRRSRTKPTGPGKLDQVVAGGQPAGLSLRDNLIKECAEEANIGREISSRAVPAGAVTYCTERDEGLRRDVLFVYDLELPAEFEPENTDGEIDEFYLWTMDRVMETIEEGDAFKFNCALVVIDFMVRHGFVEPERPDYLKILRGLRT